MIKCWFIFLIGFLFYSGRGCFAQISFEIPDPVFEVRGNLLLITYEIPGSKSSDYYSVKIVITDSRGSQINAKALEGDIGDHIPGGGSKTILWDYKDDHHDLSKDAFFQIFATSEGGTEEFRKDKDLSARGYNAAGIMIRSIALPGLGLAHLSGGKPHWIKGIAGYGCIASSIVFNREAMDTFEHYLHPDEGESVMDFYNLAVKQDNLSEVLAYSAVVIWASDIIWTAVKFSGIESKDHHADSGGLTVGAGLAHLSGAPLITFRYTF